MNDTAPLSSRRRQLRGYGVPGSPPGTLRRPSDASETSIEAIGYDKDYFERIATGSHEDIVHLQASCERVWINVSGLADIDLIREIAGRFSLHDLALEDVFHTQQRPKSEEYENHQFVVARSPLTDDFPHTEQIAKATEEISGQIGEIQSATTGAVTAIREISDTIGEISEIASAIASAVEEQSAATREIAVSVEQAAQGTAEVTQSITTVTTGVEQTNISMEQIQEASAELAKQTETLRAEVDSFLTETKKL
ncbi:MAG: hypothetical protein VW547_04930 [Alphaproteobacteria bacterium]